MTPAWDCHAHIIGDPDRFPLSQSRGYDPEPASLEDYLGLLDSRGFTNGVLVQPSVYRFDNRCMLDALDRADGRLVGVAVPAPDSTPHDLERLHERGIRGVRCNTINPGGLDLAAVRSWQPVLRELGWHVALHIAPDSHHDFRRVVESIDLHVIFDHMGWSRIEQGAPPASFASLVEAMRDGSCSVKLSGAYRLSSGPAPWSDITPLAQALIAANPAACIWGSDWPHVDVEPPVEPADVFATIDAWFPDPDIRRTILTDTPAKLFGHA